MHCATADTSANALCYGGYIRQKTESMWFVYMLINSGNQDYTGCAANLTVLGIFQSNAVSNVKNLRMFL